ncbi:MAG: hypothetical protein JWM63_5308, partial [Gammaproteobacteria bacterium]|nr:hypothetical protein [Gammaproteobacteria bacterium]
ASSRTEATMFFALQIHQFSSPTVVYCIVDGRRSQRRVKKRALVIISREHRPELQEQRVGGSPRSLISFMFPPSYRRETALGHKYFGGLGHRSGHNLALSGSRV